MYLFDEERLQKRAKAARRANRHTAKVKSNCLCEEEKENFYQKSSTMLGKIILKSTMHIFERERYANAKRDELQTAPVV